jgi:hypothetical protein
MDGSNGIGPGVGVMLLDDAGASMSLCETAFSTATA